MIATAIELGIILVAFALLVGAVAPHEGLPAYLRNVALVVGLVLLFLLCGAVFGRMLHQAITQ